VAIQLAMGLIRQRLMVMLYLIYLKVLLAILPSFLKLGLITISV